VEEARQYDEVTQQQVLLAATGGQALIDRLGYVPSFHDYAVVRLDISADGPSTLLLWIKRAEDGREREVRVRFTIAEVVDLQLEYFGGANILHDLNLYPAPPRAERAPWVTRHIAETDVEIEFSPTAGLSGWIRCRGICVELEDSAG
jgi:hypothetical protein